MVESIKNVPSVEPLDDVEITLHVYVGMPNLDPWMNQQNDEESNTLSKFENHLLSIKEER